MTHLMDQLLNVIHSSGPYHHDIELPDKSYTAPETKRLRFFEEAFWPSVMNIVGGSFAGLSVLDLGCNCGGFSFLAKKYGAQKVVGVDVRPELILQAKLLNKALDYQDLEFVCSDIYDFCRSAQSEKSFDVILLMGIIYHLANPIRDITAIASVGRRHLVIDSHVHFSSNVQREEMPLWWMLADTDQEEVFDISEESTVLDRATYLSMEREENVDYSHMEDRYVPGPHIERELRVAKRLLPNPNAPGPIAGTVRSSLQEPFSMVPNRAALVKLVRAFGFQDVCNVEAPRIAEPRYMLKHRLVLIASRRAMV